LTYTVKGDDVVKQEVYNVFDPEILDKSAEEIKELIVKTYKKEEGLKGITQNIEFKDGKVIHSMEVNMTVVNLEEMKKAMPNEVSGSGSRVSFLKTRSKSSLIPIRIIGLLPHLHTVFPSSRQSSACLRTFSYDIRQISWLVQTISSEKIRKNSNVFEISSEKI